MKNILTGWILSAIGFTIIIFSIAYFFGYHPPFMPAEGTFVPKAFELGIAFCIGIVLLILPATVLEKKATEVLDSITISIIKKPKPKDDEEAS